MDKMTRADVVAKVREHFSQPGAELATQPDEDYGTVCVYRGNENPASSLRCAFGAVLPDNLYSPAMEGSNVIALLEDHSGLRDLFAPDVYTGYGPYTSGVWLRELQSLHDEAATNDASVEDFLEALDDFARNTVTQ